MTESYHHYTESKTTTTTADPTVPHDYDDRSVRELLIDIRDGGIKLMRQELALARTEIKEEASRAARGATTAGAGGGLAFAGLVIILMGLSTLLTVLLVEAGVAAVWSVWAGPLIIGTLCAIIGAAMLAGGIRKVKKQSFVPRDTVKTLKENKRWIEQKV